jgi:hypothetical protein
MFTSTKFYYAFNGVKFISNTTISVFALDNSVITQYPTPKVLLRSTDIWSIHGDCSYGDNLEPEQVTIWQILTKNFLKEAKNIVLWVTICLMIPYFNVTLENYKRHDLLYIKLNSISKYNVFSFFQKVFRQYLSNSDLFRFQIIAIRAITMYRWDIRTSE